MYIYKFAYESSVNLLTHILMYMYACLYACVTYMHTSVKQPCISAKWPCISADVYAYVCMSLCMWYTCTHICACICDAGDTQHGIHACAAGYMCVCARVHVCV